MIPRGPVPLISTQSALTDLLTHLRETGSFAYTGVVIGVPDDSPGFVLNVYLTAYVCRASSTCAPGGTAVIRAKVALVDADPATPTAGQRQMVILSWSTPG